MLPLYDLFLSGLQRSPELCDRLPKVRRLALIETIYFNLRDAPLEVKDATSLEIILCNVNSSPYLNEEQFQDAVLRILHSQSTMDINESCLVIPELPNEMAAMTLEKDWDGLVAICEFARNQKIFTPIPDRTVDEQSQSFREMVVEMFTCSRKVATINVNRRRLLGEKIHLASTVEDMMNVAMNSLQDSEVFDEAQRNNIANVMFEGRFDLLLQPSYFDCEEKPRLVPIESTDLDQRENVEAAQDEPEVHDCPICLSAINQADQHTLPCTHHFCTECIQSWLSANVTCPTCRTQIDVTQYRRQGWRSWFHS